MSAKTTVSVFFLALSMLILLPLINPNAVSIIAQTTPITNESTISVSLGEPRMVLWGYGPPSSIVKLEGVGVSDSTLSLTNGYFQFTSVFLPANKITGYFYPEICVQAHDNKKLSTQATCIPKLPYGNYFYNIGPVILSPTLTFDTGGSLEGETVKASGKTIPDSEVLVYLAREGSPRNSFSFVQEVAAYYIPTIHIKSDTKGNYEFNLPTDSADLWRIFSATSYQSNNSAKSTTLQFEVIPYWLFLVRQVLSLVSLFRPYLFYIILFLQIVAVIVLVRHLNRNPKLHHNTYK
jgi:hypothetical protein